MLPPNDDFLIAEEVTRALAEDIGTGDITAALISTDVMVKATIISRESMLMCGQPWINCVFASVNSAIKVKWLVTEGTWLENPQELCIISGAARDILAAERTALNFLQTLAGTATKTYHYVAKLKNYSTKLLDTRKTIPGLRFAQKYAVACAGGVNHRFGLYDAFLIKENHIRACGSIKQAIALAKANQHGKLLEVEVESIAELREALAGGPDRVLLDNFSVELIQEAVQLNQPKQCKLEASGGIDLTNIEAYAKTGIDYVAIGEITKSIKAIDLSLLIEE